MALRRRPLVVEAMQLVAGCEQELADWCGGVVLPGKGVALWTSTGDLVHVVPGVWVIRGPAGEFSSVADAAVFSQYESVIS